MTSPQTVQSFTDQSAHLGKLGVVTLVTLGDAPIAHLLDIVKSVGRVGAAAYSPRIGIRIGQTRKRGVMTLAGRR